MGLLGPAQELNREKFLAQKLTRKLMVLTILAPDNMILNQKKDPRCVIKPILITLAILVVVSYSGLKLKNLLIKNE
jgi:hypothetical protein